MVPESTTITPRVSRIVLAIALLLQLLLFRQYCLREIVPVFPRAYDQTGYLGLSYDLFETIRNDGLRAGFASFRSMPSPQGILLQGEGALAQFIDGPGRLSALEVNFAHLALFEIALLAVACWIGQPVLGLALCGLLLSAGTIYPTTGGMPDFRLDFPSFCFFGTLICLAIRSAFFRITSWTLVFGVAAGILVLLRSIYLIHLAPALGVLFIAMLIGRRVRPEVTRVRLVNLTMAGSVLLLISIPSLLWRLSAIRAYYGRGHLTSGEAALRAREVGVASTFDALTYYLRSALASHAGVPFLLLAALLVIAIAIRSRAPHDRTDAAADDQRLLRSDLAIGLGWLAMMAATIYAVLTADVSKSPVVGDVFIAIAVPALLLVPAVAGVRLRAVWRVAVCLAVFVLGHGIYASHMMRRAEIPPDGADMREYARVMDTIGRLSRDYGLAHPVVSFDAITEYTHVSVLKAMAFERLQLQMTPASGLAGIGIGLQAISPAEADDLLSRSDFALLGIDRDPNGPEELYPINESLRRLAPHLYARASREMVALDEASFFGRRLTLFMKPSLGCNGESGGWMTSAGLECRTLGLMLERRPVVKLVGEGNFAWLGGTPAVTAQVAQEGRAPASVACQMDVGGTDGASARPYAITCNARHMPIDPAKPVRLHLSFDRAFVPKQRGINEDTRQLVLPWPNTIGVLPAPE